MEFTVLLICFQITLVEWKNQKGLQEIQFLKACKEYKEGGLSRVLDLHFAAGEPSVVNLWNMFTDKQIASEIVY